jgi:diguanylate cyclase (GGDEF)-like protein/PAS domain S-box-containing protein
MLFYIRKKAYPVLEIDQKNRYRFEAIKICLIYTIVGFIWIYFSDRFVYKFTNNANIRLVLSTYKGWLYAIITAATIYLLISNLLKKVDLTEKRLIKSEEQYKTIVNKMQQGIALYECVIKDDEIINYRLIDANESHEKVTGLKNIKILGKTIMDIFPTYGKRIFETIEHVAKTGDSVSFELYNERESKYYELVMYCPQKFQVAVIITEITKWRQAEEVIKRQEYNYRNTFEWASDPIFLIKDNRTLGCNAAMLELLGYDSKASILNNLPSEFSPERQPDGMRSEDKILEMYDHTMKNGKCKFEWWYKKRDGEILPVEVMMTTIFNNGEKVYHLLWRDISERKQMEQKLEHLSYHDQLTGLYNRRFFEDELSRLHGESYLPLSIIVADVNGLKLVNDSFGHAMGDELIKKVVEVIKRGCREEDIVARIGGDEFVIVSPNTDVNKANQIVNNIKALAVNEKVGSVDISISFGYEIKKTTEDEIQDIIKKAEDNMYKKKLCESPSMRGKTVNTIITALHEKNKMEEQHSHRTSKLCRNMGKALGLSQDDIEELKTVGLLHDIGKIAIADNILNKKDKLTDEEREEIMRHSEIGYRILSTVNDMSEMAEYVLAHHERWDGTGYPKGLKGEEIPLQSRIIAIADTYDAIISKRSYRDALPKEAAIEELKKNSGTQFDPELVVIFIEKVLKNQLE